MSKTTETTANETVTFEVRTGVSGTDRNTWAVISTFDTGKEAADLVKELRGTTDKAFVVVRVVTADTPKADWREREARRMETGEYTRLNQELKIRPNNVKGCRDSCCWPDELKPFATCADVQAVFDLLAPEAFAHQSQSNVLRIAYTASDSMGEADRQTSVLYDVAIDRLLGEAPQEVKDAVALAITGKDRTLFTTTTTDEMVEAYMRCEGRYGVSSCMSHDVDDYATNGIHPVSIYADGGDLALAYLTEDGEKDGPITARALVWPERKVWGRVYANRPCSDFATTLRAHGYERGDSDALDGARLARVNREGYLDTFIMPYIDGNQLFSEDPSDPDNFFIIDSNGDYSASRTDGLATINTCCCGDCGDVINNPEDNSYSTTDGSVCYSCYSENYSTCYHCEEMCRDVNIEVTVSSWIGGTITKYICSCCEADSDSYINIDDQLYHTDLAASCACCGDGFLNDNLNEDGACDDCAEEYAEQLVQEELERQARIEAAAAAAERQRLQDETQSADMVAEGGHIPAEPMTIRELAIAGQLMWSNSQPAHFIGVDVYNDAHIRVEHVDDSLDGVLIGTQPQYWTEDGTYCLDARLMTREAYDAEQVRKAAQEASTQARVAAIKAIDFVLSNGEPATAIRLEDGNPLFTCSAGWRTSEHSDGAWFVSLTDNLTITHTYNGPAGLRPLTRADYEALQAGTAIAA